MRTADNSLLRFKEVGGVPGSLTVRSSSSSQMLERDVHFSGHHIEEIEVPREMVYMIP